MKLHLKKQALGLRKQGFSIPDISRKLKISKSTASLWCRSISLTQKQKERMEQRTNRKLMRFFNIVERQKQKREQIRRQIIKKSASELGKISKRDLLIAGISLYWAEGFKHEAEKRIGFCNSDPAMMKFMIYFLKVCLSVGAEEISPRLTLNESFKNRTEIIQKFWSDYLGIPESQFTKPFYQKAKLVKVYAAENNYHGVLRIHVKKSSGLLLKMRGYMEGLRNVS